MPKNNLGERIFQVVGCSRENRRDKTPVCVEYYIKDCDLSPAAKPRIFLEGRSALQIRTRSKRVKVFAIFHGETVVNLDRILDKQFEV